MTEKVDIQMTPMIDCVFQLLIFFMLTLKIIEPEGDFSINMPMVISDHRLLEIKCFPDVTVRLVANVDGTLGQVRLGQQNLGNDEAAFNRLNSRILQIIGRPGNPLTKDMEVELNSDYGLNWSYTMRAISACTGRLDPKSKRIVRYIEKIKFAPPRPPG